MCFVLALLGMHSKFPLVVAANRDEERARPARAPFRWPGAPTLWAGRDERAGGTWLGVNATGVLVAITNRRDGDNDAGFPSRGGLCLEVLRQPDPGAAAALLARRLETRRYNPFNLLCADPSGGWVTTWRGDTGQLVSGPHVLTNRGNLDDVTQPSVTRALESLERVDVASLPLDGLLHTLGLICADRAEPEPICRPFGPRGTVSSSIIALRADASVAAYHHAEGPPSERPYTSVPVEMAVVK